MVFKLDKSTCVTPAGVHAGFGNLDLTSVTLTNFSITP